MPPKVQKPLDGDSSSEQSDQLDDTEYDDGEDYRPKNVLRAPRNTNYAVQSLCSTYLTHLRSLANAKSPLFFSVDGLSRYRPRP